MQLYNALFVSESQFYFTKLIIMKTFKNSILALFCAGLLFGSTSCSRSSGCGTWGQAKPVKQKGDAYANYKKFNNGKAMAYK